MLRYSFLNCVLKTPNLRASCMGSFISSSWVGIRVCKPIYKQTFLKFFKDFSVSKFFRKKIGGGMKMQSNGKKQHFRWRNDMILDLISCLKNFKALTL